MRILFQNIQILYYPGWSRIFQGNFYRIFIIFWLKKSWRKSRKLKKHMIDAIQLSDKDRLEFIYNFIRSSPQELYPEFHIRWFNIHGFHISYWHKITIWVTERNVPTSYIWLNHKIGIFDIHQPAACKLIWYFLLKYSINYQLRALFKRVNQIGFRNGT